MEKIIHKINNKNKLTLPLKIWSPISSDKGHLSIVVSALFDTGASHSIISNRLNTQLELPFGKVISKDFQGIDQIIPTRSHLCNITFNGVDGVFHILGHNVFNHDMIFDFIIGMDLISQGDTKIYHYNGDLWLEWEFK